MKKLALFVLLLMVSCGGGENSPRLSVETSGDVLEVTAGSEIVVGITFRNDDFWESARVDEIRLEGKYFSFTLPVSFSINETEQISLKIPPSFYMIYRPYVYLSAGQTRSAGEDLAVPVTKSIGRGDGTEVSFSGDASGCLSGTIKVSAYSSGKLLLLEEVSPNYLEGDGQGYIEEGKVRVTFSSPVDASSPVLLRCLDVVKDRIDPGSEEIFFVYGDRKFTVEGGLIKDGNAVVGSVLEDGRYVFYGSLGFQPYPLSVVYTLTYYAGGEVIGSGDGGTVYNLTIPYEGVDPESLKVFARGKEGRRIPGSVFSYDPSSRKVTVEFPFPLDTSFDIYASFRLLFVVDTFDIYLLVNGERQYAGRVSFVVYSN